LSDDVFLGNHFFSEIEKSYIEDSFNLYGLKQYLPKDYSKALDVILDRLAPNEAESEELSRSAALLYGLIHARYIITSMGLETMVGTTFSHRFAISMFNIL
jgi:casein kinase II subunit beta